MKDVEVTQKLLEAVAKSENLADLRLQGQRAAGNQDLRDFVAAIDARIAGLTTGWEADAMAKDFWKLLDENEASSVPFADPVRAPSSGADHRGKLRLPFSCARRLSP
jgi:hypothetical protein